MALTLPPDAAERLEGLLTAVDLDARVLAATLAVPAWLVGGVVRDALLGRATRDVDVVVEGDAPAAARAGPVPAGRPHASATTSISTLAPPGSFATCTVERAGKGDGIRSA